MLMGLEYVNSCNCSSSSIGYSGYQNNIRHFKVYCSYEIEAARSILDPYQDFSGSNGVKSADRGEVL